MGHEIVYCSECAQRLVGTDFEKGKAFRVEHKIFCAPCAKKVLGQLPSPPPPSTPKPGSHRLLPGPETASSARIRLGDTPRVPAPPPPKKSGGLLVAAVVGAIVALGVVVALVSSSGGSPSGSTSKSAEPADAPPPPRGSEARAALDKALEHGRLQPHDFEGLLAKLQEAVFRAEDTPLLARVRSEIDAAGERARAAAAREIAALRGRARPLLDRGDFEGARKLVEGERSRLVWRDWDLELKRFLDEIARGAEKPEPPPAQLWTVLEPREIHATWGSKAERQADGSVLLGGVSPKNESVSFVASVPLKGLRAVRVEALPDPSLPANGPGRSGHGNAVLSELRVEAGGRPLVFRGASATHEQDEWPASAAVDGHPLTGWGFMGRIGAASEAVFHAAEPFDGDALAVAVESLSLHTEHVLGRFRVSVTAAELPPPPPARPVDAAYVPPYVIYADELHNHWANWTWSTKNSLQSEEIPPFRGRYSAAGRFERNGAAFYFAHAPVDAPAYLSFAVYRAQDTPHFSFGVCAWGADETDRPGGILFRQLGLPPVRRWQRYVIPLSDFKLKSGKLGGVLLQCFESKFPTEPVYIDEVLLLSYAPTTDAKPKDDPAAARWPQAAFLAAARDVEGALDVLKTPPDDAALRPEWESELADLRLLRGLHEETRALLAKWPRGWNLSVDVLGADGPRRIDEPVLRADAAGLELRSGELIAPGRILAPSLAELFLSRPKKADTDARAAALLCAVEGFPEAAKRHHPGPFKAGADPTPDPDVRRALIDAENDYRSYATRQRALDKFAALLKESGDALLLRRVKASLKARLDAPREFVFGTGDLRGGGLFAPRRHEKGVLAWTLAEDVEKSLRKDNGLELEYSAPIGTELRGWALVGGCCQEIFAFYLQGTDVEGADLENPLPVSAKDVPYLKKSHAGHKKETERFAWVALPPLKRGGSESAKLRIFAEHQGFALAGLVLSASRKAPPKESETDELLAARPFVEADPADIGGRGHILREYWNGLSGDGVDGLTGHPKYQGKPDRVDRIGLLQSTDLGDSYGVRLRGWIVPPQSGAYTFHLTSDDHAELWLSSDEGAAERKKLIGQYGVTDLGDWAKCPRSDPVALRKNRRYYIEVLHKQGGGGNHVAVGWTLPDGGQERPIPGSRLIAWTPNSAGRVSARLDAPAAHPAGAPLPVSVGVVGVGTPRIEIFNGPFRLADAKSDGSYVWSQPPLGAHWLSARVSERGTRLLSTSPQLVVVGDLQLQLAVDLSGPGGAIDERPWAPMTAPHGHEGSAELRPPVDVARARMIRSAAALRDGARLTLAVEPCKALVYVTLWSPADPAAFDLALNGKVALSAYRFNGTGEWGRFGPYAVDLSDGRLELSAPKGLAHVSGVEVWSAGKPAAPKRPATAELVGGAGGAEFSDMGSDGALVAGFRVAVGGGYLQALRAIYRAGEKTHDGPNHGNPASAWIEVMAKPGYAVGGLRAKGGNRVDSLNVIFMRVKGDVLDPADRYESGWLVGDGENAVLLGGDGAPVVGLRGRHGEDLDALGLIQRKP